MTYKVPVKYFFPLHHVRPRFKNNVEEVLIYMATEISKNNRQSKDSFKNLLNETIRQFRGNSIVTPKTINNWRTEISALFGFFQTDEKKRESWPGRRAIELAEGQDLVHAFKKFLYFFQYPGGHIKPHKNLEFIRAGIHFKPAEYILSFLTHCEKKEKKRISINKAELTHCAFNDLRVTRDREPLSSTWNRIQANRKNRVEYDWTGDVIRYAGDILDYMEIANLLVSHSERKFYVNSTENSAILKFLNRPSWFPHYDDFIGNSQTSIDDIKPIQEMWFDYVNQELPEDFFKTDIWAVVAKDENEYKLLKKHSEKYEKRFDEKKKTTTKEIGNFGENLVHGHECMRLKNGNRSDLIHLIKCIPDSFAVGYDINSRELDAIHRFIEVKTTTSFKPIEFSKFRLSPNQWSAAESLKSRYFVYRLCVSKGSKRLLLIQDPVGLYKKGYLTMAIREGGADISFNPSKCGKHVELLEWKE